MANPARVSHIFVGLPRDHGRSDAEDPMDRPWRTGLYKSPVAEPLFLGRVNLRGDGQADTRHHGGPDKAVCVYPASRYPYWRRRLNLSLPYGSFGENFTVDDLDEESVCIGDVFRIGQATVEVSQPRSPCWKLARRWRIKKLALWFQQTGFTGWYLRVLEEGSVAPRQTLKLLDRPSPDWTVMAANRLRYNPDRDIDDAARLAACPALGKSWQTKLAAAARRQLNIDESKRLIGKNAD